MDAATQAFKSGNPVRHSLQAQDEESAAHLAPALRPDNEDLRKSLQGIKKYVHGLELAILEEISNLSVELKGHKEVVAQLWTELKEHKPDFKEQSLALKEREAAFAQLSVELKEHRPAFAQQSLELKEHKAALVQQSLELKEHKEAFGQHSLELKEHKAAFAQQSLELNENKKMIAQLSADIAEQQVGDVKQQRQPNIQENQPTLEGELDRPQTRQDKVEATAVETSLDVLREEDCENKEAAGDDAYWVTRAVQPSTWEVALFVSAPYVGISGSCILMLSILLNFVLQALFVIVAWDEFTPPELDGEDVDGARKWRLTTGHSHLTMDVASWISLASRVCAEDPTLNTASHQVAMIEAINTYQGVFNNSTSAIKVGPLLSCVVTIVWGLLVTQELRNIFDYTSCILCLPRSSRTDLRRTPDGGYVLETIGVARVAGSLMVSFFRLVSAIMIGYIGAMWLANTSVLTDLVLNASAMGFLLDLDESIYANMTPAPVQHLLEILQPLEMWQKHHPTRFRADLRPLVTIAFTAGMVVFFQVTQVSQMTDTMNQVKYELCDRGNLDFVVERHPSFGFVIAALTNEVSEEVDASPNTYIKRAIADFVDLAALKEGNRLRNEFYSYGVYPKIPNSKPWSGILSWDEESMNSFLLKKEDLIPRLPACTDIVGSYLMSDMKLKMLVEALIFLGQYAVNESGSSLIRAAIPLNATSCKDLRAACSLGPDLAGLRLICAQTCGCDYPRSGMVSSKDGCLPTCLNERYEHLGFYDCEDIPIVALEQDDGFFSAFHELTDKYIDKNKEDLFVKSFWSVGCGFFANMTLVNEVLDIENNWVVNAFCGRGQYMAPSAEAAQLKESSLRPWCPVSCGCTIEFSVDCPQTCETCSEPASDTCKVFGNPDYYPNPCGGGLCQTSRVRPEALQTRFEDVNSTCYDMDLSFALLSNPDQCWELRARFEWAVKACCE